MAESLRDQLRNNPSLFLENNVLYQKEIKRPGPFELEYIRLREREGRVYADDIVKDLPLIATGHIFRKEWLSRSVSLNRLLVHLKRKGSEKFILELGCGNGWLSNSLAISLGDEICAMDVNETELVQGARVFAPVKNLNFLYADIFTPNFSGQLFDTIILASSVQYFPDVKKLMKRLLHLLKPLGEIHILDSPFYASSSEVEKARIRSLAHFESLGFPEMSNRYFHHTFNVLDDFKHEVFFNPHSLTGKFSQRFLWKTPSPFPWIVVRHA